MNTAADGGLAIDALAKRFGDTQALAGLDLTVAHGELLALTGPSGAGKTTTCRLVAGLDRPDAGDVRLDGTSLLGLPASRRRVALMFESYALYPHLSVRDNIAFPLRSPAHRARYGEARVRARVDELLSLTGMDGFQERRPAQLSGGQKQRVALCRALAVQDPAVCLLDEPIAHLDAKLRHHMRGQVREQVRALGVPTVWCTPDAMEAIAIGDRAAVIADGVLQQVGAPEELYDAPRNVTVAQLVGDPPINLLPGRLQRADDGILFEAPDLRVVLPAPLAQAAAGDTHETVLLGIRPSDLAPTDDARHPAPLAGELYTLEPFGKYSILTVSVGETRLKAKITGPLRGRAGEAVRLGLRTGDLCLFDARTGLAIR